jgi:Zn-dependent peptidase ImmA (M78 family)
VLETLVQAEVELENLLGVVRPRNYPPQRPLMPGDVRVQAENDASEFRYKLGLGLAPVHDVTSLLELDLGVRVYVRRLDARVSGLFAYDEQVGACMLLNANHPRERRAQSAAHELGHFVSSRQAPEVLYRDGWENSREERYANVFARAFLTPARTVMQRFRDVTQGASHLTRRHVILLAHAFGVSREAMVRRLEELGLTKLGTWDWFEGNGGITNEQAKQVLGDTAVMDPIDAKSPTTLRLSLLAAEAWRQELLSEGQLARLLRLDRVQLREILDGVEVEGGDADGAPKLPH